ncbi:hypothetical protein ANN_11321 [Periplaneta americana]|uniref:MULE transposase domain-containing protein n=1 Tax=Periplaneta americana TaxID=6978 RepID=A0ABQ8T636_PERAM|nr:hypothetical protein ANN_11321 [Periplaneta americana]
MSVVQNVFPEVHLAGCLLHLGQAFWRRLEAEGLARQYSEEVNTEFKAQFNSFIALAFVPEEDVDAFEDLKTLLSN